MNYQNQGLSDPLIYLLAPTYLENLNIRYSLQQIGVNNIVSLINIEHLVQELAHFPDLVFINAELDHPLIPQLIQDINKVDEKIHIVFLIDNENHRQVLNLLKFGAFDFVAKDVHFSEKISRIINTVVQLKQKI